MIESLGAGVTHLKVGDRVIGSTGWGGMAEKIALAAGRCIWKAAGLRSAKSHAR